MILPLFGVVAVANVAAVAADVSWLEWATKPLLMPLLAAYVLQKQGPRIIVAALLLSAGGDIALQFDAGVGVFILGMVFFAAAHVCYVTFFVRSGAVARLKQRWWLGAAYLVFWLALIIVVWPGLGALRIPVAAYSLLLITTGMTSATFDRWAGVGGALFVVSDAIIGLRLAGLAPPADGVWVMSTYIVAQLLLATAIVRAGTAYHRLWREEDRRSVTAARTDVAG